MLAKPGRKYNHFGMSSHILESDWRQFKKVHATALERYCGCILEEVTAVIQSREGSAHERYLKVYKVIEERDEQISGAFNDFRRSTALMQLMIMRRMKLLTDEELSGFSEQTRKSIEAVVSM